MIRKITGFSAIPTSSTFVSHIVKSLGTDLDKEKKAVYKDDNEKCKTDDEGYEGELDFNDDEDEDKKIISNYENEDDLAIWFKAMKKNPVRCICDIVHHVQSSRMDRDWYNFSIQSRVETR